jgi:hypothetical protein
LQKYRLLSSYFNPPLIITDGKEREPTGGQRYKSEEKFFAPFRMRAWARRLTMPAVKKER